MPSLGIVLCIVWQTEGFTEKCGGGRKFWARGRYFMLFRYYVHKQHVHVSRKTSSDFFPRCSLASKSSYSMAMSQLHQGSSSALENGNCAGNYFCTNCEAVPCNRGNLVVEHENNYSSSSPLPTTEDCTNHLSSIFARPNIISVANETPPLPRNEEADDPTKRRGVPQNVVRFVVPTTTKPATTHLQPPAHDIHVIGSGSEQFEIKFCIEKCRDVFQMRASTNASTSSGASPTRNMWLSYRFVGTVVQSEVLSEDNFIPVINTFRIKSSLPELARYFNDKKHSTLRVYLCTEGEVLGTSFVDLRQLIAPEHESESRMVQNEYFIKLRSTVASKAECDKSSSHSCSPRIFVRMCIDHTPVIDKWQRSTDASSSSTSSQTIAMECDARAFSPRVNATADKDSHDKKNRLELLQNKEHQLSVREAELSKREKETHQEAASLERKCCEWEQWRCQQEIEWQEKLRHKEGAMLKVVEERAFIIEKERLSSLELSKNEYEKLEARLRKALIDVEAKERQSKDTELGRQHEHRRRLAELESREKLLKEELKHSIEIEVRLLGAFSAGV